MYGTFTGFLDVRLIDKYEGGRRKVLTLVPLTYEDTDGVIIVPAGTSTDFASVPWFLWWLFPAFGIEAFAALLHDYLLTSGLVTRKQADLKFREAMRMLGVPQWRRNVLWAGVRSRSWFS